MKTVGVIPARFGSTRFPGKPLHKIYNQTLIEWVIDSAKKSKLLDEVIVATDHKDIFEKAKSKNVMAVMTDSALPTGSDRVWQAVQNINCELVVNIQGDEPLLDPQQIDRVVELLNESPQCEMSTLVSSLKSKDDFNSINIVKVILNKNNEAIYFSRFGIPLSRGNFDLESANSNESDVPFRHIGMYGYRKFFLEKFCNTPPCWLEQMESLEQLRALWLGAKIKVGIGNYESIGVDTLEDAIKVERWLVERKKSNPS